MFPPKKKKMENSGDYKPSANLKGLSSKEIMPVPFKKYKKKSFAASILKKI